MENSLNIPAHLEGLVWKQEAGGALICHHMRQLSFCAECAPKAEQRFLEASKIDKLDEFAAAVPKAFLEPGVPEVERRASADLKVLEQYVSGLCTRKEYDALLASVAERVNQPIAPTFTESWASYRAALYAIHGTLSVAHSLLHNEVSRTPVGSDSWETLGEFMRRVRAISEALSKEIERVPEQGMIR